MPKEIQIGGKCLSRCRSAWVTRRTDAGATNHPGAATAFQVQTPSYAKPRKQSRKRRSNGGFNEADSWGEMFDIGFNSFVTPKLLKVVYTMWIVGFVIYGVVVTIMFAMAGIGVGMARNAPVSNWDAVPFMASSDPSDSNYLQYTVEAEKGSVAKLASQSTPASGMLLAQGNQGFNGFPGGGGMPTPNISGGSKAVAFFIGLLTYVLTMFGLLMGLMLVRVFCEVCLAQFYR